LRDATASSPEQVKVLFATCSPARIPEVLERYQNIFPELPLLVVSEFAPPGGEWIPYHILWSLDENVELCRARLAGRTVRLGAIVLDGKAQFRPLRRLAFRLTPWFRIVYFNHDANTFQLHPRGAFNILRHLAWSLKEFVSRQLRPGGGVYTWLWRFAHPRELRRPLYYRLSLLAGKRVSRKKRSACPASAPQLEPSLPEGISVVIPSRDGRDLLAACLPPVLSQLDPSSSEVIVVDNGSTDGTTEWLAREAPAVVVERSAEPLSFARAVNRGIRRARFSHVCLLNNDMVVEPGFFEALRAAFGHVPDLFCATAQIFLPEGQRREETGKAVMPVRREPDEFPLRCDLPVEGEEHSYVLYGSGGASLYDARKLRAIGAVSETFEPAYVEDLDLGFNGWRQGWPAVFVAGARVLHRHRSTTSRYYSERELRVVLERNYLRFLTRSVSDPVLFATLWREAIWRVLLASINEPAYVEVLRQASRAVEWLEPQPPAVIPEAEVLAAGSGSIAVFPGRAGEPGRTRVMVVSPYVPFPLSHGGAVRMFNLMRRAAADFDQLLVCFVDELQAPPVELREICAEVVYVKRYGTHAHPSTGRPEAVEEFDSPAMRAALHQTVRKWTPHVAQLEFTQMAQYARDCQPARTVLVEHDITLDLYSQLLAQREDWETRRQYEKWLRFETAAWGMVDRVVVMSEKDLGAVGQANAVALPNGVDIARFQPSAESPEPRRILLIGSFAHLPNVLAMEFFLRESWPLLKPLNPSLHIIAGSRPEYYLERYRDRAAPQLDQPGIELEAFVADVRPAYRRAAVVIAPLLASAGTNIKIMEAMAMGKAIVSTPAGINGLDELQNGRDVVVVNSGEEMARAIAELIANPERRSELERRARETAVQRYDWDVIAKAQERLYRELVAEEGA
jgi:GT2 family glycosyltransferase/glycosyltransferase involved in cell wall biosynthesis